MTLTKEGIVELIMGRMSFSQKEAKQLLELVLEEVKNTLEQGNEVKISGFGKWNVRSKKARPGRNPHTGETLEIAPRKVVTFHPSEKLKKKVNRPDPAAT